MNRNFVITAPSHVKSYESTRKIMWSVLAALLPAGIAGVFIFGLNALLVIIVSTSTAILSEALIQFLRKRPIAILDASALITGLLLAYNLSPAVPLWLPRVGAFVAIAIAKQAFGGLGFNIFNPALVGRAFLLASWPGYMTMWLEPRWQPDALSAATPLGIAKEHAAFKLAQFSYLDLFIGNKAGCIGEVCIAALLVGGIFLLIKGYISLHTPLSFIGTVAILSWIFLGKALFNGDWLFFILSGGLILGAFFMATDYVTTPITRKGQIIFGIGCGIVTFLIRKFAGYPEGVSYSILMMNAAAPLIDRFTRLKKYGAKR